MIMYTSICCDSEFVAVINTTRLIIYWLYLSQNGGGDEDSDTAALKYSLKQSIARQQYDTFAALTFAAKAGDVEVVRDLIRRGASINAVDYDGRSAFAMVVPYSFWNVSITCY